jgi:hypothetical protein
MICIMFLLLVVNKTEYDAIESRIQRLITFLRSLLFKDNVITAQDIFQARRAIMILGDLCGGGETTYYYCISLSKENWSKEGR